MIVAEKQIMKLSILCRYVRAEVVAGFVNTLFLLFVAFFIFAEAIEASMNTPNCLLRPSRFVYSLRGYSPCIAIIMWSGVVSVLSVTTHCMFATQRSFEPPTVHHDRLMLISVAGFVVNLIGLFAFQHGGAGNQTQHLVL